MHNHAPHPHSNLTPSLSTHSIAQTYYTYSAMQMHTSELTLHALAVRPSTTKYFVQAHPYIQTLTRMRLLMHAYSGQASLRPPTHPCTNT